MTDTIDDQLWSAIGEPSRRRVLDVLVRDGEATASAVSREVPFTRQAVTKHLAVLESARLVTRQRTGREVRYQVDPDRLDEAAQAMTRIASTWDRRLVAIKRLAEATHRAESDGGPT